MTHGSPIGLPAYLLSLHPERFGFTGISTGSEGQPDLVGQMQYTKGEHSAHLEFLLPTGSITAPMLPDLVEELACEAGEQGAYTLLAELEEDQDLIEELRRCGFCVYAWQCIWKFTNLPSPPKPTHLWRAAESIEAFAIRSLCQALLPPLVQGADPLSPSDPRGWIYVRKGEVLAYVEVVRGPRGIYLLPLIHPDVSAIPGLIEDLLRTAGPLPGRPIYIAARSYQTWLEGYLTDLKGQSSARQALLVKHLVAAVRTPVLARLAVLENRSAGSTAPVAHNHLPELPRSRSTSRMKK